MIERQTTSIETNKTMKNSALQLAKQIVYDNKQYISGNIAEHMILEIEASDNNILTFLTEEEIEDIENPDEMLESSRLLKKLTQDVKEMLLKNFNFDIEEFDYNNF